jgi:hypothetical protein
MDEKHPIPRHVDSRRMILGIPSKIFLVKVLPLLLLTAIIGISLYSITKSKIIIFVFASFVGLIIGAYTEFKNKRTGIELLKANIKYKKRGNVIFNRANHTNRSIIDCLTYTSTRKEKADE